VTFVRALLGAHLSCAAAATLCFWGAAMAAKGQPLHRAIGFWFARFVYCTAGTGAWLAILRLRALTATDDALASAERQTMWLVLYVLLIIVAPVQHGLAVVAAGPLPRAVSSLTHATLNVLSIVGTVALVPAAMLWQRWVFLAVAPLGLIIGLRNLRYGRRGGAGYADWRREHLTSQLTAGITLHTALLVFGSSRTLGLRLTGIVSILPWVVPAIVGVIAMAWLRRRPA
jgi:hypothetical protein